MEAPGDGFLVVTKTPPAWKIEQSNKDEMMEKTKDKVGKQCSLKPPQPSPP